MPQQLHKGAKRLQSNLAKHHMKQPMENLANLKLAVDNVYDHVIITDPDGYILYANKAAEELTGYTFEEMKGQTPRLWGRQMKLKFYQIFWRTIKVQKKFFIGELHNKRKNGEIYFAEIRVAPVLDKNKKVKFFVGIERDVTKEKEIDRMKSEFIYLTTHQLRTPLTVMKGFLDLLSGQRFGKINKEQKEFIQKISSANEGMIGLVGTLLNIARLESGRVLVKPILTNLNDLVNNVAGELKDNIIQKKLNITATINKIPKIKVDVNLIRQVYLNLLSNAIKYTRTGGTIRMFIRTEDGKVISSISDNGYGIPKDEQAKIFQKFFRASNITNIEPDGTGLGLYLVRSVVGLAKGEIGFESKEGQGTTFWFSLPTTGMKARGGEVRLSG